LLQEVNFFKKLIFSKIDNFENSYAFNDENALKAILRDNDNPLIFNTNEQWLFLLNKNLE
jgi:hypothetical protein